MSSSLIVSILFISAFISGLSVFFVKRDNTSLLKLILSFSGAYLFSITVLHLIPHVYISQNTSPEIIGLYILGGFLFQLVLEQFSQGIEHGHIHHSAHNAFPLGIMISLCLHAFLEGMPLAAGHQAELVFGIAIHHVPAAFALGSLLLNTRLSKTKITTFLLLFAIMTPLGFLTSKGISEGEIGNITQYFDKIMAIVIGIFLHISTTILFESGSADHHKFNRKKMIAVILGVLVSLANFLFDGHDHHHHGPAHDHHHDHEHHHHHEHHHDHDADHSH
ncbi:ZIP family metal transporter [Sphingobacterium haloxyli]|uniref:Zinc/iron permease n=1 Tax=Sphingobacterium haloxyli TaxID=2100533 RepID=A0A2S9J1J6_9SPHI|nr:ZIP family metal transporter [Sphingobacterium haloxyli]PRD46630.1 zinc/iron permease [Sphingobacterium haloxyli]